MSNPTLNGNGILTVQPYVVCNHTTHKTKVREKLTTVKAITLTFLFSAVALFSSMPALAQESEQQHTETKVADVPAKEGTYQFIFRSADNVRNITLSELQLVVIEKLRKDDEPVYAASLSDDYIKLKIIPRNSLNVDYPKNIYLSDMSYEEYKAIRFQQIP
ncbi:MAG: hypothetical protein KIS94_14560 [Chitinophagales bacterium]|nr:hypothetical protein [Chitinophagales bacterium]